MTIAAIAVPPGAAGWKRTTKPAVKALHPVYPWLVIHDPSGDFLGRCFRQADLVVQNPKIAQWEEGTIFWNMASGDARIWRSGRYQILVAAKNRKRSRA